MLSCLASLAACSDTSLAAHRRFWHPFERLWWLWWYLPFYTQVCLALTKHKRMHCVMERQRAQASNGTCTRATDCRWTSSARSVLTYGLTKCDHSDWMNVCECRTCMQLTHLHLTSIPCPDFLSATWCCQGSQPCFTWGCSSSTAMHAWC